MQRWLATSFIIIAGLMAMILADQYLRTQAAVRNSELLETTLKFTGMRFEQALQQRIAILEDIAALTLIYPQSPDYQQFSSLAGSLRGEDSVIQGIAYAGPDGSTQYYFPASDKLAQAKIIAVQQTDAALLEKGHRLRRTVAANPVVDASGQQLMTVLVPLLRGDELSGFIRGSLNLTVLLGAILKTDHQGISFQLRDAEGRLFYGPVLSTDDIRTYELTAGDSQWILSDGWQGVAPPPDTTVRSMLWLLGVLLILTCVAYINRQFDYARGLSLVVTSRLRALREETRKLGQNFNGHLHVNKDDGQSRSSERELERILEGMQDTYFRADAKGRIVRISRSAMKLLGYKNDEMIGMPVYRLCQHAKDRRQIIKMLLRKGAAISDYELLLIKKDGGPVWVSLNAQHCGQAGDSGGAGIEGTVRDISSRKKAELQISKLSKSFEQAAEATVIATPECIIEYVNPAFEKMTGYRREEMIGKKSNVTESENPAEEHHKKIFQALLDGKIYRGVFVNFRKDGSLFYEDRTITPLRDEQGEITHIVSTGKDVTARIHLQHAAPAAHHDVLTGLPGHEAYMEMLEKSLLRARSHHRFVAVMLIDMGCFKDINNVYGHDAGKQVKQVCARRIMDAVRDVDVLAHLDGDKFAVLLDDVSNVNHVSIIARKIVEAIAPPVIMERNKIQLTTSAGISIFPEDGEEAGLLLKNANSAMIRSRNMGRNNYQFYSADMSARALARLTMENGLRHALERDEFLLHYQPQLDIHTNQIVGAEALLRWQHPELGLLSPGDFVPLLEESGLIETVGAWVLEKSFSQARTWHDAGFSSLRITVNLSNRQFNDPGFITTIENIIKRTGIDPGLLELELTESVIMRNTRTANAALDSLDKMGVKFSIDDFGTGYSSLYYLKRFPVDTLKIDRSFVHDVTTNPDDAAIVSAIIGMGHEMKLKVIAEGVENNEQMAFLREHDCDIIQGFLFSQPLLPAGMTRVLREKALH